MKPDASTALMLGSPVPGHHAGRSRAQPRTVVPQQAPARAAWMDVVRGAAVLLILGFHATVFLEQYGDLVAPAWVVDVNTVMTPLRIPLLTLLSGMLLDGSLRKGRRRYFEGKLRNVAWPYLVWVVLWGAASWPVYSVVGFALGGSYMWFLLYLFSFYCLAWVLRRVPPELVVAVALAASALAPEGSVDAERWPSLFAVFMAGQLLVVRPVVREWLFGSRWAWPVAALLLALHLGLSLGYDYGTGSTLFTAAGAIALVRLSRRCAASRVLRPLRFVGRSSLVYYVAHYPLMAAVAVAASTAGVSTAAVLLPTLVVLALAASTALACLKHARPVRWLFSAPGTTRSVHR